MIVFSLSAILLKPRQQGIIELVGPEDEVSKRMSLLNDHFSPGPQKVEVKFFFGVDKVQPEDNSYWSGNYKGELVFDDSFDLAYKGTRRALLDFCKSLRSEDMFIKESVNCWLEDFDKLLTKNQTDRDI